MTQKVRTTTRTTGLLIAGVFVLSTPVLLHAQDVDELNRCAAIGDDLARLACYDDWSGRHSTVVDDSADEEYAPLTDDIGVEGLDRKDRPKEDYKPIRATVTECRKDANRRYFFYFDNGQVWKQKDGARLSFKECNFSATITKDFFGYKMQLDGKNRHTRISRVK